MHPLISANGRAEVAEAPASTHIRQTHAVMRLNAPSVAVSPRVTGAAELVAMQAVLVALIAVLGTLGGSAVTGLLQRRHADRAADLARRDRQRQEQRTAICDLAEALVELRRRQIWRWSTRRDYGTNNDTYREAKDACFEARTTSRACLLRLRFAGVPEPIVRLAGDAFEASIVIEEASDAEELTKRAEVSRVAMDAFVAAAASHCAAA